MVFVLVESMLMVQRRPPEPRIWRPPLTMHRAPCPILDARNGIEESHGASDDGPPIIEVYVMPESVSTQLRTTTTDERIAITSASAVPVAACANSLAANRCSLTAAALEDLAADAADRAWAWPRVRGADSMIS